MKQRERHDTENDALRAETEIYSKFELKFVAFYANMIFKNERNVAWILGCPKKPFCCTRKLIQGASKKNCFSTQICFMAQI